VCTPKGDFPHRDGPALLEKLTDELLVVASDVVASVVAAEHEPISGKDRYRLLAWVVADARGAGWWRPGLGLSKDEAETVGKRLDRQAAKVRGQLAQAEEDRASTRAEGLDEADLAARLKEIDAAEQHAFEHARNEIYVGYHELDSLMEPEPDLTSEPGPEPGPEPELEATHTDPAPATQTEKAERTITDLYDALSAQGIRCPFYLTPGPIQDRSVPPDLVAAIGSEAVEELRATSQSDTTGDEWWAVALPCFVKRLRAERARLIQKHKAVTEFDATELSREKARLCQADNTIAELEEENDDLKAALERAKGREEALHEVIQRCRWS
jgi:hypothetical protein